MSDVAIKIENLSKQYRLGQVGTGSFSQDFNRWLHKIRGLEDPYLKISETNDRSVKATSDWVWALKDINLEFNKGEVVGIIGRNGAGKSTLLKVLSRVTGPTTGSFKVKGRIASLLEVGTGFHPELTGRENIFLNGAILGMSKLEIKSKFDEIVAFSGIERYIDTPVKRYSSGMYVRLAFAVAAHLESEILIVDEVLAVGDSEFQKKCLGKMKSVSGEGRTVLFVSHNLAVLKQLCQNSVLMEFGKVKMIGDSQKVINEYLTGGIDTSMFGKVPDNYPRNNFEKGYLKIQSVKLFNSDGNEINIIKYLEPCEFRIEVDVTAQIDNSVIGISFVSAEGEKISFSSSNDKIEKTYYSLSQGKRMLSVKIDQSLLPGTYSVSLFFMNDKGFPFDAIENFGSLSVENFGKGDQYYHWARPIGFVNFKSEIKTLV